MISKVWTSSCK